MPDIDIRFLTAAAANRDMLADIMVEAVAHGGSVSFMHPLEPTTARAFWAEALAAADQGERLVLGAWDGELLVGTVTLVLSMPQNQLHRAEIAKMMTRVSYRGRGIAAALLRAAEAEALVRGRTLLVLDTAAKDGGAGFYEKQGFVFAGEVPDYALTPHRGMSAMRLYWKRLGTA